MSEPAGELSPDRKVVSLGQIFDVDNSRLAYRVSGHRAMNGLAGADGRRERAVVSTHDELGAVDGPEDGIDRTTYDASEPHESPKPRSLTFSTA